MESSEGLIGQMAGSGTEFLIGAAILVIFVTVAQTAWTLFGKLREFPGPLFARCSPFWLVWQGRLTRRSNAVMEQHRKHGDFVRIAPNHISINRPDAVAQIYAHKTGFLKSDFYNAFLQVTPVVFNCRDTSTHQRKRKYMNPAFSARALLEFEPYMDDELRKWQVKLLEMTDNPKKSAIVDFAEWTNYLAFDVIGSFAFGKPFGFINKGYDDINLISTIDTRGEVLNALGAVPMWLRRWMRYNVFDSFWYSGLRATANLEKISRAAYQQRKDSQDTRKDLLSYLFAAQNSKKDEAPDEREIIAESISFIVGGSDTTSSTMTNFLDVISRDPVLQKRLQKELDDSYPGEQPEDWVASEKEIQEKLPLLLAALREVMRTRPTSATGLPRTTPKGGVVIGGRYIPEGTIVSVPTCGVLSDPRVFENPNEFSPDRWLQADVSKQLEFFLPFSTGPRACIGRNFAWMEILKALVIVMKRFDVQRTISEPTVIREGFFNKAAECNVYLTRR